MRRVKQAARVTPVVIRYGKNHDSLFHCLGTPSLFQIRGPVDLGKFEEI